MEILNFVKDNPNLLYFALIALILVIEAWLGKTPKLKSGSLLELILTAFLKGK